MYRERRPLIHGFRKFFNTALMNADVAYAFKELLMVKNSQKSRQKLLDEYSKAIDALTINEENRLRRKVELLTVRVDKIMELRKEMDELKQMMNK